jgi:hypothetical protein
MLDPNFQDSAQQQRLSQQKMEAMKLLMDEIVTNPSSKNIDKLKEVMDFLDVPSSNTDE